MLQMKHMLRNFPGSPLVKNPGANAGNMGSFSGLGTKITHAARQLTLCIMTTNPELQSLWAATAEAGCSANEKPQQWRACTELRE